jgi:hypothetical protein
MFQISPVDVSINIRFCALAGIAGNPPGNCEMVSFPGEFPQFFPQVWKTLVTARTSMGEAVITGGSTLSERRRL